MVCWLGVREFVVPAEHLLQRMHTECWQRGWAFDERRLDQPARAAEPAAATTSPEGMRATGGRRQRQGEGRVRGAERAAARRRTAFSMMMWMGPTSSE
jgi:hypothetical protein